MRNQDALRLSERGLGRHKVVATRTRQAAALTCAEQLCTLFVVVPIPWFHVGDAIVAGLQSLGIVARAHRFGGIGFRLELGVFQKKL